MALAYSSMLIHKLLKKDPDIVPEEAPVIFLDIKYAMCMSKNSKDNKHTRHIVRKMRCLRNGKKFKMHKIDRCEVSLKFSNIADTNVGEPDVTPGKKYIMVRHDS